MTHHSSYSMVVRGRLGSDMSLNTSTNGTSRMAACAASGQRSQQLQAHTAELCV